ncbi:MAG TPA: LytTR family DNA-binding domain-containing protein, partial [Bacteroidia bacterium]|nr:LytTR family DNA-binding domain-containing protein [Bacteroidia bacterium]
IEADRNYTTFYLVNNKTILISKSLIEFEEILSTSNFFRVHHSNLINLYHVLKIDKQNMQVIMSDNSKITIASRKKEQLFSLFDKTRIG